MELNLLVGFTESYSRKRSGRAQRVHATVRVESSNNGPVLSICGEVWNARGNDIETGGQMVDRLKDYVSEWNMTKEQLARVVSIWERWHLNGMRAGCEHQRAEKWHICPGHYGATAARYWDESGMPLYRRRMLEVNLVNCAGTPESFQTDRTYMERDGIYQGTARCSLDKLSQPCPTCGYKFGSQWLYEPIPAEVWAEVRGWFPSDLRPAFDAIVNG